MALTNRQTIAITMRTPTVPTNWKHKPAEGRPVAPHDAFAFTIEDAATNLLHVVGHDLQPGDRIRFTSAGTLPAPLAIDTDYYVLTDGIAADDFKVSLTESDPDTGVEGDPEDITDAGSGAHHWSRYLTEDEQLEFDRYYAFINDGIGTTPPPPALLPHAVRMIERFNAHYNTPAFLTWWHDDQESRDAQYRLRKAEILVGNDATVPPSADEGGEGEEPPISPIPHGDVP